MTKRLTVTLLTALSLGVAGCGGAGSDGADRNGGDAKGAAKNSAAEVDVKTFIFRPDPLEVKAGTTVSWKNHDEIRHTVTSGTRSNPDGKFDGSLDGVGSGFEQTFERPGRYRYFCSVHPGEGMEGEVLVER